MPAEIINTQTFNRSKNYGWYTRLLYSYVDADLAYIDASTNFFGAVNSDYARGTWQLPAGYWSKAEGRILRIQGCFLYSGDNTNLNITAIIKDSNGSQVYSAQNRNNDHQFATGENHSDVPVFFELELSHGYGQYFDWSGYYQYEFGNYNSSGDNTAVVLVPIHGDGSSDTIDTDSYTSDIRLAIGPENIQPVYLTIEELG